MSLRHTLRVLRSRRGWGRLARERLTEPLHLNILSAGVLAFGSYTRKIDWDLVYKQQYAYGVLKAARLAQFRGVRGVTLVEMGVASGAGLLNLADIAAHVGGELGVQFHVYGFDSGCGMPPARDYRDHPEYYGEGDFPMDAEALEAALPPNARLILGDLDVTIPPFLRSLPRDEPIGFVAVDVDYHSSTVSALKLLTGDAELYLPTTVLYFDDIIFDGHNRWQGQLLAIEEFNDTHERRKIEPARFLPCRRIFKNAIWLHQIYSLHVLDHPVRTGVADAAAPRHIPNEYLLGRAGAVAGSAGPGRARRRR